MAACPLQVDMNGNRVRPLNTSSSGAQSQASRGGPPRTLHAVRPSVCMPHTPVGLARRVCPAGSTVDNAKRRAGEEAAPASRSQARRAAQPRAPSLAPTRLPPCPLASLQVTIDKDGGMMAKYYLMQAGMVDLSCRGGCQEVGTALRAAACSGSALGSRTAAVARACERCAAPRRAALPTHASMDAGRRSIDGWAKRRRVVAAAEQPQHLVLCGWPCLAGGSFGLDDQLNYAVYGPGFDAQLVLQVGPPAWAPTCSCAAGGMSTNEPWLFVCPSLGVCRPARCRSLRSKARLPIPLSPPHAPCAALLQSKLAPPPEFQPVYSRLNEFVKEVRARCPKAAPRCHGLAASLGPACCTSGRLFGCHGPSKA